MSTNPNPASAPLMRAAAGGMNLNDSVYERLLRERIIFLGSQVDDVIANQLAAQMLLLSAEDPKRDIHLYINSPGGSVTAGMDWDTFLSMSNTESREAYDADQRKTVEQAVKTQFILDAIADAREVTVDNDDLSAQIMAQAQRNRMSPEQYAQQLQQAGNIAEFVADVRRTKTLAQLLEEATITDASGNVVDLEALRPQTRPAAPAAEDEAPGPVEVTDGDCVVGGPR